MKRSMRWTTLFIYSSRAKPISTGLRQKHRRRKVIVLSCLALCLIPAIANAQSFVNGDISSAVSSAEQNAVNSVLSPIQSSISDVTGTVGDATGTINSVRGVLSTIENFPGQLKDKLSSAANKLLATLKGSDARLGNPTYPDLDAQIIPSLVLVKQAISQNTGQLGVPDPAKTQAQILQNLPTLPNGNINPIVLVSGQVTMRATDKGTDLVLGVQGQQEHADAFKDVIDASDFMSLLSQSSDTTAQAVLQTASKVSTVAQASGQSAQNSTVTATTLKSQAAQIKAATSTQDAVKGLADQNASLGTILANQSVQSMHNATGLVGISGELSGISNQTAQSGQQLNQIGTILSDQDKTLRGIEVQNAIGNLNLSQLAESDQGRLQQAAMGSQREYAQLDSASGYRLVR